MDRHLTVVRTWSAKRGMYAARKSSRSDKSPCSIHSRVIWGLTIVPCNVRYFTIAVFAVLFQCRRFGLSHFTDNPICFYAVIRHKLSAISRLLFLRYFFSAADLGFPVSRTIRCNISAAHKQVIRISCSFHKLCRSGLFTAYLSCGMQS